MSSNRVGGLFITGTDTGIGKTYVGALIAEQLVLQGHRVGVYKPVASGCSRDAGNLIADDALALWDAAGRPSTLQRVTPQCFEAPLAPHLAARREGKVVDAALLRTGLEYWRETTDLVIVEGAGGLMSPISDGDYNADLAAEFAFPLVVVAPNTLGVINQTLQTLITAACYKGRKLPVAGIVLNHFAAERDLSCQSNRGELETRCDAPLLCEVAYNGAFDAQVDWLGLARL